MRDSSMMICGQDILKNDPYIPNAYNTIDSELMPNPR